MVKPVAGDVVVIPFPHTNLQPGKERPALVVGGLPCGEAKAQPRGERDLAKAEE